MKKEAGRITGITTRELGLIVYIKDSENIELKNIYSEESEDK